MPALCVHSWDIVEKVGYRAAAVKVRLYCVYIVILYIMQQAGYNMPPQHAVWYNKFESIITIMSLLYYCCILLVYIYIILHQVLTVHGVMLCQRIYYDYNSLKQHAVVLI